MSNIKSVESHGVDKHGQTLEEDVISAVHLNLDKVRRWGVRVTPNRLI